MPLNKEDVVIHFTYRQIIYLFMYLFVYRTRDISYVFRVVNICYSFANVFLVYDTQREYSVNIIRPFFFKCEHYFRMHSSD